MSAGKKTLQHPKADENKRRLFRAKIEGYRADKRPIVYLDESGFEQDMPRAYGYSVKGKIAHGIHDWNVKRRTNAIGALLGASLIAVTLFDCTINTDIFYAWCKQLLIPVLPANSVIVMDNASFHKREDIYKLIADAGHQLEFLPPYSPDLNPIENKWANVKDARQANKCSIDNLFKLHVN